MVERILRLVLGRDQFDFNDLTAALQPIAAQLSTIQTKQGEIMATMTQFSLALSKLNDATNTVADVLRAVRDKVAELETNAGITATDEESVLGQLDAAANALTAMAQTPENPVPVQPTP